jgi:hypothetical protein
MPDRDISIPAVQILRIICILMMLGLLVAGLAPFNPFPRNEVRWIPGGKGLEFFGQGQIETSGQIAQASASAGTFCGLTIRIRPKIVYLNNSATFLAFYAPDNPSGFRLMQYRDELLVRHDYGDDRNHVRTPEIEIERAFTGVEPVDFMITSGPDGTVAYRNGLRVGASAHMKLSCADLSGQLVIGDSPVSYNPWVGTVLDLAIYNSGLKPQQRGLNGVTNGSQAGPPLPDERGLLAHYSFSERSGQVVHNVAGSAPDLQIPRTFQITHKKLLILPWNEVRDKLGLRDITINIVGFMPFGLVLLAYLEGVKRWQRALTGTVLAGFAISLTIEILQAYLPSRTSGVLDIINNTLGTYLGALLFRWSPVQTYAAKLLRNTNNGLAVEID